jgi:hypothetical protein
VSQLKARDSHILVYSEIPSQCRHPHQPPRKRKPPLQNHPLALAPQPAIREHNSKKRKRTQKIPRQTRHRPLRAPTSLVGGKPPNGALPSRAPARPAQSLKTPKSLNFPFPSRRSTNTPPIKDRRPPLNLSSLQDVENQGSRSLRPLQTSTQPLVNATTLQKFAKPETPHQKFCFTIAEFSPARTF